MKRRFAYCAVLCMLVSLVMQSTLAYFTAVETARNVVTSGGIEIQVVERQETPDGLKPYPSEPIQVMPGSEVSKVVSVQNLDEPAWARMAYTVSVLNADGTQRSLTAAEVKQFMAVNADTANWTYKDGWWYYGKALATGEESKPLFTEVSFSGSGMGDAYQNNTIVIDVVAQAVQQIHNGNTVMDAAGWPEA